MNILLSLPSYHPGYGGPFFSVGALASALADRGHRVGILACDFPELPVQTPPEGVELFSVKAVRVPLLRASRIRGGRKAVEEVFERFGPDVVHDNGLWLSLNHRVSQIARQRGLPIIHSPRGCLDPWAMRHRYWKKRLALALYQRRDLEAATCFHAASELEAESIRNMTVEQPIAVIPNGIELPEATQGAWGRGQGEEFPGTAHGARGRGQGRGLEHGARGKGKDLENSMPGQQKSMRHAPSSMQPDGQKYALFLGRLHPIKNLPTLLRAWAEVRPEGWRLVLAGSDEEGHRSELEAQARALGISEFVAFPGPVYDEAKWELIRGASLAFLISHSENFGISAAEALVCGVPVIASKTTPWECLEEEKIGWWVEGDIESVAGAIREAVGLEDAERDRMAERSRMFVQRSFAWKGVAERFEALYASL